MKRPFDITCTLLSALLLTIVSACHKDEATGKPSIRVTVKPDSGNTTNTFTFDLSGSQSNTGRGPKVFSRWDWEGDGNWDTPFTHLLVYTHRYRQAGTWNTRLQMTNLDGGSDTVSLSMPVTQGFSPPRPVLKMIPETGNPYTRFLLDATGTRDDEDSLDHLKFRWDFEGDDVWDTPFGDSAVIHHEYPQTGSYLPRVEVRDESGLAGRVQADLEVTLTDPDLIVSFRCIPDSVTDYTETVMDASASSDPNDPDHPLRYRWDWDNDRIWDTEWLPTPTTVHVFKEEFFHFVKLQVMSHRGLVKDTSLTIRVWHSNRPPIATFSASTWAGNVNTDFRLDAWLTRDVESAPAQLWFEWDFDGDGHWDEGPNHVPVVMHRFTAPGTYNTTLRVTDSLGFSSYCSKVISISHGNNQTGIYLDNRGQYYEYYGIVLIGDQWWFSRNLSLIDQNRDNPVYRKYYDQFYNNFDTTGFRDYGMFYFYNRLPIVCPQGWRVPSRNDWEKLFANYPADRLYEALMPGGESDFGASLGGNGIDVSKGWNGRGSRGDYWTTSPMPEPSGTSIWIITFDQATGSVLKGYQEKLLYSVRCMKDK
jgi:uncharacterized protein (TIGR02145 family)